jgi:hypothetical protein
VKNIIKIILVIAFHAKKMFVENVQKVKNITKVKKYLIIQKWLKKILLNLKNL